MGCRLAGFALAAISAVWAGQPAHSVTIQLPPGVRSQQFFARYALAGGNFGGWVEPRADVSAYVIDTTYRGHPANAIRAILYAPGCAIQTLDVRLRSHDNPTFPFVCHPVSAVRIAGSIVRPARFQGHQLKLQASWVIRWAAAFLWLDGDLVTSIPIDQTVDVSPDHSFVMSVPDLAPDATLEIWARDRDTGDLLAQLIPVESAQPVRTKMGGLQVRGPAPSTMRFALCEVDGAWRAHDQFGFVARPQADDSCAR